MPTPDHYSYSVIIPTYNRAHTIVKAIESALNQTSPPLEIIVADDESTDDTEKAVKQMENAKIKYLKIKHFGRPAGPRNAAIKIASGKWLAFLDSDDEWKKDKMAKQFDLIKETGLLAAGTNANVLLPSGLTDNTFLKWQKNPIRYQDLLMDNYIICSSAVINADILNKTKGFPEDPKLKAIEDYALWLQVSTLTAFAYVNEPLVIYKDDPKTSVRNDQFTFNAVEQKKLVFGALKIWAKKHPLTILQKLQIVFAMARHTLGPKFKSLIGLPY